MDEEWRKRHKNIASCVLAAKNVPPTQLESDNARSTRFFLAVNEKDDSSVG